MPIHISWKSMALGMKSTYCQKGDKMVEREFSDGSKTGMCSKAWSVFFATLNKHGWDDTKPRPESHEETEKLIEETMKEFMDWAFGEAEKQPKPDSAPSWVAMATKLLKSDKGNPRLRQFWQKRLSKWCKTHSDHPACK